MIINGNLKFHTLGSGELQNAVMEKMTTAARGSATPAAGRLVYDTDIGNYYYGNGSSWVAFGGAGTITNLQNEVDAIETASGGIFASDGTWSNVALTGTTVGSATDLANALNLLDAAVVAAAGVDTLAELTDVTITGSAAGQVLYTTGANTWVNGAIGATSGVQAYDAGLASIAGLTTAADTMIYTTALDTYATTTLSAFGRTLIDDANAAAAQTTLGLVPGTNVQAYDAALTALSNVSGTGFLVQTGVDTFLTTTLAVDGAGNKAGLTIADASGTGDAPTIGLSISGLAAETGTLSTTDLFAMYDGASNVKASLGDIRTGILTAGIALDDLSDVAVTTHAAATYILRGDGTEFHVETLELGDVENVTTTNGSVTADVVNVMVGDGTGFDVEVLSAGTALTFDTTGTAVTLNVDDVFLSNTGDTLDSGVLSVASGASIAVLTGGDLTIADTPVNATDAVNKNYVDNLVVSGTVWRSPIVSPNMYDVVSAVPGSPVAGAVYIKNGGTQNETWGTVTNVVDGDIIARLAAGTWSRIDTLSAGDRFIIAGEDLSLPNTGNAFYTAGFRDGDLIQYVSGSPTAFGSWTTPSDGGYQVVAFDVPKLTGTSTGLTTASTTYDLDVSVDGVLKQISVSTGAGGADIDTFGELAAALNTALGAAYSGATVVLEPEGHFHVYSGDDTKIIVKAGTLGSGGGDLLAALAAHTPSILAGIQDGTTVTVSDPDSVHYAHTYLYSHEGNEWIEISGPAAISAGTGLAYTGNILNVNLGAGIAELPSDEVGLDLYATNNPLLLTSDGSTPSTATGAKLHVRYDNSTVGVNGSTQLYIPNGGVTATQLNSGVAGLGIAGGAGTALSFAPVELTEVAIAAGDHIVFEDINDSNLPKKRAASSFITDLGLIKLTDLSATDGVKYNNGTGAFELDIVTLGTSAVVGADEMVFEDNSASGTHIKRSVTNFLADMDIVTAAANGMLVRTAADTYASRTITPSVVAGDEGISVVDGDGVAGNPTVGLDIFGLTAEAGTPSGTDVLAMFDGTNNVKVSISQLSAAMDVAVNLGDLNDVVQTDYTAGDILVADGTNSYDQKTIQFIYSGGSATSHTVTHNLGQQYCNVTVVDASDEVIIPQSITFTSANVVTVTFNSAIACKVIVMGIPGVGLN